MPDIYKPHPSDLWETPPEVFDPLDEIFYFELDVCAQVSTAKCSTFFTAEQDAFRYRWDRPFFMNPPYRNKQHPMEEWMGRAVQDSEAFAVPGLCLVKAAPETKWFQTIWKHAQLIVFFRRRIKFHIGGEKRDGARFPNALAVFGPQQHSSVGWKLTQFGFVIRSGQRAILLPEDLR